MANLTRATYPVQTLRENTQALEASVLLCLAKPGKTAVHRLRTSTRRIEARFELLSMLPNLPPHAGPERKAVRLLRKLHHAAGEVRDLDVQRDLIRGEATRKNGSPRRPAELGKESRRLRRVLKRRREELAGDLLHLLNKHRTQLPIVLEELLEALAPAESIRIEDAPLAALIRDWYAQHTPSSVASPPKPAQLHDIRKRAKLARYLAESAPPTARAAHRLAAQFEKLQQAGGEWHDWLLLAQLSARELGDSAKLPQRFTGRAERALGKFKRQLSRLHR